MAGKEGSESNHKALNIGGAMVYYLTILVLLVLIVFMYFRWNERKAQFAQLVQEAAADDRAYAIELNKDGESEENQTNEDIENIEERNSSPSEKGS